MAQVLITDRQGQQAALDIRTDMATMDFIGGFMARYLQQRMANPGTDLLSELATSTYPDGTKPDIVELMNQPTANPERGSISLSRPSLSGAWITCTWKSRVVKAPTPTAATQV